MKKYIIEVETYVNRKTTQATFTTFEDGLAAARLLTEMVNHIGWTRHETVKGVIHHSDTYFDLYLQGNISLHPIENPIKD